MGFRKLNDEQGDCATLLTLLFRDKELADKFAAKIDAKTLAHSGWHVYNNMEQIINKKMPTEVDCPFGCGFYGKNIEYRAHMLPQTDAVLERAVNISIGVVDKGLGAGFGINILSNEAEIKAVAEKIKSIMKEIS